MIKARHLFSRSIFTLVLCVVPALASVELLRVSLVTPRALHEIPFTLARAENDLLEVTDRQPFSLAGYAFGDFDLYAEVELPMGGEMDLLFRLVEPWRRKDGSMPGYHGRFSLLRMSAVDAGPVYRSSEQALFDSAMQGGQLLAPGVVTSIHLQARGRRVRANIAGVQHPWYETRDDRGGLAVIVRGGTGVVHSFEVTVTDRSSQDLWLYVGGVGGLVALLLLTLAVPVLRLWPLLVFLPLVSWLGSIFGLSRLLPEIEPTAVQLVVHALCGLPLAVVLALRGRLAYVLLAVLAPLGFWSLSLGMEAHGRLRTGEDPRLTQHFGRDSGIAPRDALSRRLHAKTKVHRLGSGDASVFFLGGGELYEPWPLSDRRPVAYLPLQVETAITEELGRDIEAIVLPTEHATAAQQLLLFEHFYLRAFDPEAVVFGIGDAEQQRSVEDLQRTLEALAQLARTAGFRVLVLQSELLAPAYGELIDRLSKDHGWPLLRGLLATEPSRRLVAELVEQLVRALR